MKRMFILLAGGLLGLILSSCTTTTTKLPPFGAELGSQHNPVPFMDRIRIPYKRIVSYFGYIKSGSQPDEVVNGKKMYYLYVWIPAVAPEIGIRMVSPAPKDLNPGEGDFVSPLWGEAASDPKSYFDTWISWERALEVINPADIATRGATTKWLRFDANDDSSELPAQPSGKKYNSVLRIVSDARDPLRSLVRGLYRIGFTSYKRGEVQGGFYAQVGVAFEVSGLQITSNLADMAKLAK
jgi:hypothetical protein